LGQQQKREVTSLVNSVMQGAGNFENVRGKVTPVTRWDTFQWEKGGGGTNQDSAQRREGKLFLTFMSGNFHDPLLKPNEKTHTTLGGPENKN